MVAKTASTTRPTLLVVLPLVLLTFVIYIRVAWHPFINFDDGLYVFENPRDERPDLANRQMGIY
jgi:hypothetical protein